MTLDVCTNSPGFTVFPSFDPQTFAPVDYCVPASKPPGCPLIPISNPVGVPDPRCNRYPIKPKNAFDPNDKSGTLGATEVRFVANAALLSYIVHFENLASATAPAQVVVVTDQLDPQKVDLDTFQLGPVSFGQTTIVPPPGLQAYTGGVDLRPDRDLIVVVEARLDRGTGRARWSFVSVDPATGQAVVDPDAGLLPPNTAPPAGEGSVAFVVKSRDGLATATQIANQARVTFDLNSPIVTPMWLNTIDRDAPASRVQPLPATQSLPTFSVQWSGTDAGAGIQDFTVLVSDNGGPFQTWLPSTAALSGTYSGQIGHTYGFLSIARDLVGNVEPAKNAPEAWTTVQSTPACARDVTAQLQVTRSGFSFNLATQRFVQMLTLKNTSSSLLQGPLSVVLDNLSSNATTFNPSGVTSCASPAGSSYVNTSGNLEAGGTTSLIVQFVDPARKGITYSTRILSGSASR